MLLTFRTRHFAAVCFRCFPIRFLHAPSTWPLLTAYCSLPTAHRLLLTAPSGAADRCQPLEKFLDFRIKKTLSSLESRRRIDDGSFDLGLSFDASVR